MTERGQRSALAGSLALNLVLAAWLLRPPGASTNASSPSPELPTPAVSADATGRTPGFEADGGEPAAATPAVPPRRWSEIESDDYRQYIGNLRAVGCPEAVIRDLVAADLAQLYAPRAAAIWQPKWTEYWQKSERSEPSPSQIKDLRALRLEQGAVYQALLVVPFSQQARIDLAFLQLHGAESELLFLPDDRRKAALDALEAAGLPDSEMESLSRRDGYSLGSEQKRFDAKLKLLADVLTPAEVDEFRVRYSPAAQSLRTEVKYFDCSADEFRQLLDARERSDNNVAAADFSNRGPATDQVRRLFGEERAKEFERASDLDYVNARDGLELTGQPAELADHAYELSREVRATTERLALDSTLSIEERKRRLEALRTDTDRRLNELLGERAAHGVRHNLGVVLEVAEANLKP